jgi:hypothetical protein
LRARTRNGDRLKVNVEIAVLVWRGATPPRRSSTSTFEEYVAMKSETAVRHLASVYAYDSGETDGPPTACAAEERR